MIGFAVSRSMKGPGMVEAVSVAVWGVVGSGRVPLRQLKIADIKAVGRAQRNTRLISNL